MPSATPAQRDAWRCRTCKGSGAQQERQTCTNCDGTGETATMLLKARGFVLRDDFIWTPPTPTHRPSTAELRAVRFMMDEWDYGGIALPDGP